MTTHYDDHLAAVLDEPATAAQIVFPHYVGSALSWLKRKASSSPAERGLKHTNLLAVTAERVLIFPVCLTRAGGMTLEAALLDWERRDVVASGVRRCHLGSWTGAGDGRHRDYVLLDLAREAELVRVELPRQGSQTMVRALGATLTGTW
jgi:hypothetical protein